MNTVNSVIVHALRYCEPSAAEEKKLASVATQVMELLSYFHSPHIVGIVAGGSFAKGTWVKGDADLDIFVKIQASVDKVEYERLGMAIGLSSLKSFRTRVRYSEHPYVEAFVRNIRVIIVPCYDVER